MDPCADGCICWPCHAQARSRQCAVQGCGKRPVFNFAGEKLPTLCQLHKQEGMVDVLNRLCTHPGARLARAKPVADSTLVGHPEQP